MPDGKEPKDARQTRTERLEAQLRANLKRRKEQARSRAPFVQDLDQEGSETFSATGSKDRDRD